MLAMAAQCLHAAPTAALPAPLQARREGLHLRRTLLAQRDAQRRCLAQVTCQAVRGQWVEGIALLQQRIKDVSGQIAQAGAACSRLRKRPGLGPILRATLAARLPELGTVHPRKIVALVGLAPFNRASGRWRGQRRIQGGRAGVRRVLSMAAWAWIRTGSPLSHTYARLTSAGKPTDLAILARMHKYLRWLNAIARNQVPHNPPVIAFCMTVDSYKTATAASAAIVRIASTTNRAAV
ncbi:IS110 family transposase [Xanthomonas theicola]|nr:IS110 family transposase [Xanthomonas theicola]